MVILSNIHYYYLNALCLRLKTEWIDNEEVPEYKLFTDEPKAKRQRRHKKYARESLEAREIKKKLEAESTGDSLHQQIMKRNADRASSANNFFDRLIEKYGGVDDSEEYEFPKTVAKKLKKNQSNGKASERKVKNGRVTKNK